MASHKARLWIQSTTTSPTKGVMPPGGSVTFPLEVPAMCPYDAQMTDVWVVLIIICCSWNGVSASNTLEGFRWVQFGGGRLLDIRIRYCNGRYHWVIPTVRIRVFERRLEGRFQRVGSNSRRTRLSFCYRCNGSRAWFGGGLG